MRSTTIKILVLLAVFSISIASKGGEPVRLENDEEKSQWHVLIEGRKAFTYQYGDELDLVHYWPLYSPSGRNMLVQKIEPYPHHRSFWFADTVQLSGDPRKVSFYNALYSGRQAAETAGDKNKKNLTLPPYRDHIRHARFISQRKKGDEAVVKKQLIWEYDYDKPLLDELRKLRIVSLGDGEYLLDITFTLKASYGDVHFVSDAVHYAWPYIRINKTFSGDNGGTITNDNGDTGQEGTHAKPARWIDYSNTVDGVTEGLAVFQFPDGAEHEWLTREYGTFGPRRENARSGKEFTLKKDRSMIQRVGVLVHRGDVKSGRVAERYELYAAGKL